MQSDRSPGYKTQRSLRAFNESLTIQSTLSTLYLTLPILFNMHSTNNNQFRCADCEESEVRRTHNTVWTALDNVFKSHLRLNGVLALLRTLFQHISGQRTSYCSGDGVPIAVSSPLVRIRTPEALSERIITSNTFLISLINSLASPSPHITDNSICKIYCT